MFDLPIELNSCGKQHVGNTTNHFRSRWNKYKSDVGKAESGDRKCETVFFAKSFFTA